MPRSRSKPERARRPTGPPTPPLSVAFVSLGCPKNLVDSEKMLGLLAEHGVAPTPEPGDADVIVINTCGFLQASKDESLAAVRDAVAAKRTGRTRRVVVAGCLATRMGAEILDEVPGVDALVGVHQREQVLDAVTGRADDGDGPVVHLGRYHPRVAIDTARLRLTPRHYAYLRISEGCSRGCSFCTIPSIRGPMRSKPIEAIETEARELIADGALELNLIGQDTTSYGRDIGLGGGLAELLRRLDRLDGACWVRLLYAYPSDFSDEAIDAIASAEHVVPYLDIPLQHISDRVLKRMRRRVTRRQTEALLARLRERIPGLSIRTTFISGFPGETDAEHRELLAFIEEFRFDMLGVFSYSQEPSTPAGRMDGQLPQAVRDGRRAELMAAQQRVVLLRNAALAGTETAVLVDAPGDGRSAVGRTPGQAPEVDSVTLLRPTAQARPPAPGRIVPARIVGFDGYDLIAEPTGRAVAVSKADADGFFPIYQPIGVARAVEPASD